MSLTNLSPRVQIREIDRSNFMPAVGMATAAHVMEADWGYANTVIRVSTPNQFVQYFGKSNDRNYVSWLGCMDYLSYSGSLDVVRVVDVDARNADNTGNGLLVRNRNELDYMLQTEVAGSTFISKFPGELGNSLAVELCDASTWPQWSQFKRNAFTAPPATSAHARNKGSFNDEMHVLVIDARGMFTGVPGSILERYAFVSKGLDITDQDGIANFYRTRINQDSAYINVLDMPDKTLMATDKKIGSIDIVNQGIGYTSPVVTIDGDGDGALVTLIMGTGANVGKIIGTRIVSAGHGYTAATIKVTDPTGADFKATVNLIAVQSDPWGTVILKTDGTVSEYSELKIPMSLQMAGGKNSTKIGADELINGWSFFRDAESNDATFMMCGDGGGDESCIDVFQYVIDNVAEKRQNCVAFLSPPMYCFPKGGTHSEIIERIDGFMYKLARSSSFMTVTSGWGIVNDPFSTRDRSIPLSFGHAGLVAQTTNTRDAWVSAAGLTRGKFKNIRELTWSPVFDDREELARIHVNSVVNFRNEGITLFGDRTGLNRPSFFQSLGVRFLFILMRKVISRPSMYVLFETNNDFTRSSFVLTVRPWLELVQGRGGINRFRIVCDESNNPEAEVDKGNFVAYIVVNPTTSIQSVDLYLVAAGGNLAFTESPGSLQ